MKTALITGASGAIGSACAKELLNKGYFVCFHYNSGESQIEKIKEELKEKNLLDRCAFIKADLSCDKQVYNLANTALNAFSHIDVLVHSAGIDLYSQIQDTTDQDYDKVFNVNVKSAFILSKVLAKKMIERKSGSIIYISSVWGISGASLESVYSASKSALIALGKSLAKELALSNITVNSVCPGVIDTKMNDIFSKEEKAEIISQIPLNRMGTPEEVAKLVGFLATDGEYITGQAITIDGGYIL